MTPAGPYALRLPLRIALGALLLIGAGIGVWYVTSKLHSPDLSNSAAPERPDPRLAYAGPYRNIHPSVATVGTAKCAECHAAIAETYARHPMGMSILAVSSRVGGETMPAVFAALGSTFRLDLVDDRLRCTETWTGPGNRGNRPLYETTTEIAFAIGSGSKGRSFLMERDGFVLQSPVSWFSQKHIWDASPGFPPELHAGRPVTAECLYCHANEVVPVRGALNRFEPPLFRNGHAIGCERCHGPGSEHVRVQEAGWAVGRRDYSIVNPAHLETALREAVCQQCHLEGEARVPRAGARLDDYRPGLPLDAVIRVLVRDHGGEDRKAVNHVEQMYLSKCFTKSKGALGCTTCHDPHNKPPPEARADKYRTACLKCHECSSPVEFRARAGAATDCVACHMPRFAASDIVHTASTDHRIVRGREPARMAGETPKPGPRAFLFFPAARPDPGSVTDARDYALGLAEMVVAGKVSGADFARDALPLLERAIAEDAGDVSAWNAKSLALQYAGRKSEALAAAKQVLTLMPSHERGLTRAATLAADADQAELAIGFWRRAIDINPANGLYRQELAVILAKRGDWSAARPEAEEAIRLDPARATARTVVAIAELRAGSRSRADEMFQVVVQLGPANLESLRKWYEAERGKR